MREQGRGKETRYMCFLNYCVSKSIEVVPCFIVWAVSRGEEFDKPKGFKQQMLAKKNQPHSTCDHQTPTAHPPPPIFHICIITLLPLDLQRGD